jgi:hypothetical protein
MRVRTKFRSEGEWLQYACDLLNSPLHDVFAKALDVAGWMIVPQPEFVELDDGSGRGKMIGCPPPMGGNIGNLETFPPSRRWRMREPCEDCPDWAQEPVQLRVIDGDKKDDA